MSAIEIAQFDGIAPIYDNRRLPNTLAQTAENVEFVAGDVRTVADAGPFTDSRTDVIASEVTAGDVTKLFYLFSPPSGSADGTPAENYLLKFCGSKGFSAVRNPTAGDKWYRTYFYDPNNDYVHMIPQGNAAQRKRAGMPPPSSAPVVTAVLPNTAKVIASISKTKPILVSTTAPHEFADGDIIMMRVPSAAGMVQLDAKEFSVIKKSDDSFELRNTDGSSYTDFVAGQGASVELVIGDGDVDTRSYVFTYVSQYGEESPPSLPSELITVASSYGSVNVDCFFVQDTLYSNVANIRVYRSVTGQNAGTGYMFVGEFVPSSGNRQSGTDFYRFNDATDPLAIGELLQSNEWYPPPKGLKGLVMMPNGFAAGFVGNQIYFSDVYQPHAWPPEYRKTTDDEIVDMQVFSNNLIVITKGSPCVIVGSSPDGMSKAKNDSDSSGVIAGCAVSTGGGVIFPSYDGLMYAGSDGSRNLTQMKFTEAQWRAIYSSASCAEFYDGRYYLFSNDPAKPTYIVDMENGEQVSTLMIGRVTAAEYYPPSDSLLVTKGGSQAVLKMFAGAHLTGKWKSSCFTLPKPMAFCWGRVLADFTSGPITLRLIPSNPTNTVEESTVPAHGYVSIVVPNTKAFRIPSVALSKEWTCEVEFTQGAGRLSALMLGQSLGEVG